jgi:hypothetical protein
MSTRTLELLAAGPAVIARAIAALEAQRAEVDRQIRFYKRPWHRCRAKN